MPTSNEAVNKSIHAHLSEIVDPDVCTLVDELGRISSVTIATHGDMMLLHFLQTCVYPNGASEKHVPISREDLDAHDPVESFLLRKKIRVLTGSQLYQVCREIAEIHGCGIEMVENQSLHLFLSRFLKLEGKRKRAKPVRLRW